MKISVVSHDAGCSELLCALIDHERTCAKWHIYTTATSPMASVCSKYALPFEVITDPVRQLESDTPDLLLFGTGWQERIERPFVNHCKKHRIPTVAFLDHWSNYRERFGFPDKGWEENLGDFTALSDPKAFELAQNHGLPSTLKMVNHYLINTLKNASRVKFTSKNTLLFLSEPTASVAQKTYGDPIYWGFTQFSALEEILNRFDDFGCDTLTIRLHPSDTAEGYRELLDRFRHIPVSIYHSWEIDLNAQLMESKIVIGFDTMALYIGALLGKSVISYLPSSNRDFLLPLPQNRQLRTLDELPICLNEPIELKLDNFGMDFASFLKIVTGKH